MHHGSVRDALDAFEAAQSSLASDHNIDVQPLPASLAVAVSQQQAEDVALRQFGVAAGTSVNAMLVSATANAYAEVMPNGTRTLLVSNRAVWLVLIPNQQVPIHYPRGRTGPPFSYTATLAVFIDANSGDYVMAPALAS
jgi:hypothetical protein